MKTSKITKKKMVLIGVAGVLAVSFLVNQFIPTAEIRAGVLTLGTLVIYLAYKWYKVKLKDESKKYK